MTTQTKEEQASDYTKISPISGKQLKFRAQLSREARIRGIKVLLGKGYTDKELGSMLQCSDRTIRNYKRLFFDSDEYWLAVDEEIYSLLHDSEVPKVERLRHLVTLKTRHMLAMQVDKNMVGQTVQVRIIEEQPRVQQ